MKKTSYGLNHEQMEEFEKLKQTPREEWPEELKKYSRESGARTWEELDEDIANWIKTKS